uniref:Uncharacterized protein n=1 Tax=Oryza glaberrima TaxID=4538 RepID=I1PT22_ORYGL
MEILQEMVRVLRADPHAFTSVLFFLLCPASVGVPPAVHRRAGGCSRAPVHVEATPRGGGGGVGAPAHAFRQAAGAPPCRHPHRVRRVILGVIHAPPRRPRRRRVRGCGRLRGQAAPRRRRACLSSFLALLVTACSTLKSMLYPPDIVVCAGLLTVLAFFVVGAGQAADVAGRGGRGGEAGG